MTIWLMLLAVVAAGAVGGAINALTSDNGFLLPKSEEANGTTIVRPGYLGNIGIGAVAAVVSWGLYGPLSSYVVVGFGAQPAVGSQPGGLSLAALVGAILVGVGGARWLSNEVDKTLLRAAASEAANTPASKDAAKRIALATPAQALRVAKEAA
jgi:hypothetical protein